MILKNHAAICLFVVCLTSPMWAQDYRAEVLEEAPPADAIAAEVLAQLNPRGVRVLRGAQRALCDIWLCRQLAVKEGFEPTSEVLYPFTPGQLIGAVRFARDGYDFRDQEIPRGVYTLRYQQQPVDGNHVGTSLTRDFLLLVRAGEDSSVELRDYDDLVLASGEVAGAVHPCLLSLHRSTEGGTSLMRHDEGRDWWIVTLSSQSTTGAALPVDLVVVGLGME